MQTILTMNKEELFDFHIRNNWFKISRYYNQLAARFNTTFSWGYIILHIEKEGTPSTALGPKMGMEPTSLSRTLKNMEDDGIIIRKQDQKDKRKAIVYLTDKGIEMRRYVRDVVLDFNQKLYDRISQEEIEAFFNTTTKIDKIVTDLLVAQNESDTFK